MSSTDANTKEQLVKFVKGWIQMDNEIKEHQKEIKERRNKKKEQQFTHFTQAKHRIVGQ